MKGIEIAKHVPDEYIALQNDPEKSNSKLKFICNNNNNLV